VGGSLNEILWDRMTDLRVAPRSARRLLREMEAIVQRTQEYYRRILPADDAEIGVPLCDFSARFELVQDLLKRQVGAYTRSGFRFQRHVAARAARRTSVRARRQKRKRAVIARPCRRL
jgi:hypothetical protein